MATARPQVDWFRVPLDPELLKELNATDDRKGWIQAGGHLALTAATAIATVIVWRTMAWYWVIPVLLAHGAVQSMLGSGVHELVHERVFATRWPNRAFLAINSFLSGWNYPFFEISHKDHHRYTLNQPHDLEVVLPSVEAIRNTKPETRWQTFIRLCQHVFGWKAIWPTLKRHWDFARGSYPHNNESGGIWCQAWCEHLFSRMTDSEKRAIRDASRIFLLGHGAIVLAAVASGWWIVALVIPLGYFFGGFAPYMTGMPQHAGLVDEVDDFRLCCRTYTCSRFFQFLYWNMNYHIEHHMYAAVPCYNLPRLHEAVKEYMPPIHTSLYSTWCEIKQIEFRQRIDPAYQYAQPLPENLDPGKGLKLAHVEDKSATDYLDLSAAAPEMAAAGDEPWKVWECDICGFIYDEALGLPEEGIAPGTRWDDIPDDWHCPDCGVAKANFSMIERSRVATPAAPVAGNGSSVDSAPVVIVGSGMAGYAVAKDFRHHNRAQPVVVLTRDGGESYSKPLLSNALAMGKTAADLVGKSAADMAAELDVDVRTGVTVDAIDREAKILRTSAGDIAYSKLALAIGADQRKLPLEGDGLDAVVSVNDLDDYGRFRSKLPPGGSVVVIGAGLIGCEFANDLVDNGYTVAVLDVADAPLAALVPREAGEAVKDGLAAKGVDWRLGASVSRVDRDGDRVRCALSDGGMLDADIVLSAVGLAPRTDLARAAGLEVERGIVTDAFLATSDPDIYAVGDCAEVGGQVRPFIAPLRVGAVALARTLAGTPTEVHFPPMPVLVKTPACSVVAQPAPPGTEGRWQVIPHDDGLECHFLDDDDQLHGFALTGGAVEKKEALIGRLAGASAEAGRMPTAVDLSAVAAT